MKTRITILGCAGSAGVPLIGCDCSVCTSDNPKNQRSRASVLIERAGKRLLVDVSPDIRQQALQNHFKQVDAILITHAHADHCHGIDDVRAFNYHANCSLPIYADAVCFAEIKPRFPYVFEPPSPAGWIRAALDPIIFEPFQPITIADGFDLTAFPQQHGDCISYGLRIGNFAYSTDVKAFPDESEPYLKNLELWIVDCLSLSEKPTHAHLDLTLTWIEKYRPKRAILTHMGHDIDYESFRRSLPQNVDLAYDSLVLESE